MRSNMIDRISTLPDEVLCHILSFLSTEEAVATNVLSKRWKPLWTSVPVLHYDDQIYIRNNKPYSRFEKFVYATILARDEHQPITTFRLNYAGSYCDNPNADINAWLKAVIRRGVENLDIDKYRLYPKTSLSCCIFRCTTLVALKLTRLSLNVSSVELPSLKSLHLEYATFTRRQHLEELLRGCPILEDLEARVVYYVHEGSFCKEEFKRLTKLARASVHFSTDRTDIPLKAISNVEFLCMEKYQLAIVVPEFRNLVHMVLKYVSWDSVLQMLKNCPMLQVLEVVSVRCPAEEEFFTYPHFVPECLNSQFIKCSYQHCYGTEIELHFAKYIMQNSTTLQTMKICCVPFLSLEARHEMLKELALCPRRSTCQLSFQ